MAVSVSPTVLPAPKKNSHYQVILTGSGASPAGTPLTWSVSSGALPGFLSLRRLNDTQAVVEGKVPSAQNAGTFTCTIQCTDGSTTASVTSTSVTLGVDGPDPQGYHGSEANRSTVITADQFERGTGLPPADAIARMWPLSGPAQN
jgi:hypothetical protein